MWSGPKDLTKYFSEGTETINGIWRGPKDLTEYFLSSRGYCTVPGTQIHKGIFQTSTPTTTVQYVFSSYDRQTVRDQPIIFIHLYGVQYVLTDYSTVQRHATWAWSNFTNTSALALGYRWICRWMRYDDCYY